MALNPADIAVVSRLIDQALELPAAEREAWLAALPAEHQVHQGTLRDMLAQEAQLDTDPKLAAMPQVPVDESVAKVGDRVGPYRLLREIGRGGMGSVWLAERADGAYQRQVALKLPRLAWGAGLAERMAREREIGMMLEHSNIARLYDAGVDERGRPFLALEFVDGQPIDAWCEAKALSVRGRLKLFVQVAKAVAYAHGRLVVHRDLKPSNVLVAPDGQAHLLDFGIAKLLLEVAPGEPGLTQEQGRVLTPHYASPEQVAGAAITVQSDVYSLGVLLYELLTGTLPIAPKRGTLGAVEDAILEGDAPLASGRVNDKPTARALRGEVDAILAKAMQRDPGRRYPTADALAMDIERHLNGETVTARPDSLAYRTHKALKRHWLPVSAVTVVLASIVAGGGLAIVQARRAGDSFERERLVKGFMADVFRANSHLDGRSVATRDSLSKSWLEGGAQLIEERFRGQPEVQAELYELVSGVFFDMGAYRQAAEYQAKRVQVLSSLRGSTVQQAKALVRLAQAHFEDRRFDLAEVNASAAADIARGNHEIEASALTVLAWSQAYTGRADLSTVTLEAVDRLLSGQGESSNATRAWATSLKARHMYIGHKPIDETVKLYEQAIEQAISGEGPLSHAAIRIHFMLAWIFAQEGKAEKFQLHLDRALTGLRRMGGAHEIRAAMEEAKYAHKRPIEMMSMADRQKIFGQSRMTVESARIPVPKWFVPQIQFWAGSASLRFGNVAAARGPIEESVDVLWKTLSGPWDHKALALDMAVLQMTLGRHQEASKWLNLAVENRRSSGEGQTRWAEWDYYLTAKNLIMSDQLIDAANTIESAPRSKSAASLQSRPFPYDLARAEISLAKGDAKSALKVFPLSQASDAYEATFAQEVLGQVNCEAGQPDQGLALLKQRLIKVEREGTYEHDPSKARLRAVTGLCAIRIHDRAYAKSLAASARAAFTAQPEVSPYYKAPLFKLERALGLKLPAI